MSKKKSSKFKALLISAAELYSKFWDLLSQDFPSYDCFQNLGFALLMANNNIAKFYRESKKGKRKFQLSANVLMMYAAYVKSLQDDPQVAEQIQREGELISSMKSSDTDSPTIIISVQDQSQHQESKKIQRMEAFGVVKKLNASFCSLLGYLQEEVIGQEFITDVFFPKIFHNDLRQALKTFALIHESEDSGDHIVNWNGYCEKLFMWNKCRFIVPITLRIVSLNGYLYGNSVLAIITRNKENADVTENKVIQVLANTDRVVIGTSSSNDLYNLEIHNALYLTYLFRCSFCVQCFAGYTLWSGVRLSDRGYSTNIRKCRSNHYDSSSKF